MNQRKVKDAKDLETDELIYFKGHAKATYMSDGRTVEDAINSNVGGGSSNNGNGSIDLSGYATKLELEGKVDKVDGKQLSTEDFTTLLKQKLDGLSNYDDTTIQQSVSKLRTDLDTLVSGDTTTAIKTFNEVIAFLDGLEDTEDLASIIASIEQQIAAKGTYTKPSNGIPKSDLASEVQTSLNKADTALQEEQYKGTVASKDANMVVDELWGASFEILPNGNIKVTANGVSKEFMSATPSGDPMHNVYVNVGAEYNDTGDDIIRTSIYGDNIVWKKAHWWLNDLGDITNDEMRDIYIHANITQAAKSVSNMMQGITTRTNIATWNSSWSGKIIDSQLFGYCTSLKTALFRQYSEHYINTNASWLFVGCPLVEKVFPTLNATSTTSFNGSFDSCSNLKEIRIKALGTNCSFAKSNLLSNASILYMIKNSSAKTITITLHTDAYNRAMADSEIVEALNEHTNVTLAKA